MTTKKARREAPPADTPKVFISSTLEDLKVFRPRVNAAIQRLGWTPIDCGYWSAGPNEPLGTCLARVDDADVVVVVVAHRHGWTPPGQKMGEHKSITRLECERARAKPVDVLPFFVDENANWDSQLTEESQLRKAKSSERAAVAELVTRNLNALEDFKAWLNKIGTRKTFKTPDQLETEVYHALSEWAKRRRIDDAGANSAAVRARYLDWLKRTCETVELLGLDLKQTANVRLGQVYVPAVTLLVGTAVVSHVGRETIVGRDPRLELLLHRLGQESLYVPGKPGAGKSTFCRWVALVVASRTVPAHPVGAPKGFEESLPTTLMDRLPLLCRLREWASYPQCIEGGGVWTRARLEDSLATWIDQTQPGGLTAAAFLEVLKAGRCLLILDGVDEIPESVGPHLARKNFLSGLADALHDWLEAGNRVLLTSRPYGLEDADRRKLILPPVELMDLPDSLQETFIRRWFAAADPTNAREKAEGLVEHLRESADLANLRSNPMLLTALCVKFDEGKRLPEDLYELYDSLVSQVLHKRYDRKLDREQARMRLEAIALGIHKGPGDMPRATPVAQVTDHEIDQILAHLSHSDPVTESGAASARERREDLLSNSGLLLPGESNRAGFYHLSFQEFLAAERIARVGNIPLDFLVSCASIPHWRKTLTFLFQSISTRSRGDDAVALFQSLLPLLEPEPLRSNPNPALALAKCLEAARQHSWNLESFHKPIRRACDHALENLPPAARAALWSTLGRLGLDDRRGVGVIRGVPDIDWVDVPAGGFLYGEGEGKLMTLPAFKIARYLITNSQYQAFIDDDGYENDTWWKGLAQRPESARSAFTDPNQPRETVSWFEAMAFCHWLDQRMKEAGLVGIHETVRLPTEREWEKTARGRDGLPFPWGEQFIADAANINEDRTIQDGSSKLLQTSAVGIYPRGQSPYKVFDLIGNVFEWCEDRFLQAGETGWGEGRMVLRGSAWYAFGSSLVSAVRIGGEPFKRHNGLGFRVVLAERTT